MRSACPSIPPSFARRQDARAGAGLRRGISPELVSAPSCNKKAASRAAFCEARLDYGCGTPATAKARKVAYLSPILRASLYSAVLRQALIFSTLSHWITAMRPFGGAPSITVMFEPAARILPPFFRIVACAFGAYSLL